MLVCSASDNTSSVFRQAVSPGRLTVTVLPSGGLTSLDSSSLASNASITGALLQVLVRVRFPCNSLIWLYFIASLQWEAAVGVISRAMFDLMSTRTVLRASRLHRLQQWLDGALRRCAGCSLFTLLCDTLFIILHSAVSSGVVH